MRLLKTPVLLAAACCVIAALASSQTNGRIEQRQRHLALKGPESPQELMQAKTIREAKVGKVPNGALRAAIEQKARISGKATCSTQTSSTRPSLRLRTAKVR